MNIKNPLTKTLLPLLASAYISTTVAEAEIDCALRDAPFSVELPLIDVIGSPTAKAVVQKHMPHIGHLPPQIASTKPPSMATIMSLRNAAGLMRTPAETIEAIEADLSKLKVSDDDRRFRCQRYDADLQSLDVADAPVNLLIFTKINGFDHGPSVTAATDTISKLAETMGWGVTVSNNGGVFTTDILARFDAVIWNNVSGDALTLTQRSAFENYIKQGGGYLGIHGSGGDSLYLWDWYVDTLLGAHFIGHPSDPQFQDARVNIETSSSPSASDIGASLAPGWTINDEWYSFKDSPRLNGADVIATLDESTYTPDGYMGQDLRMGDDHPIVWSRCIEQGRAFYSAIGHRPEVYELEENLTLLKDALLWTSGQSNKQCPTAN